MAIFTCAEVGLLEVVGLPEVQPGRAPERAVPASGRTSGRCSPPSDWRGDPGRVGGRAGLITWFVLTGRKDLAPPPEP